MLFNSSHLELPNNYLTIFDIILGTFSLDCMVGIGRLSIYPITKDDIRQGNYPGMDEPFKSMSCSEHGSQIPNIETLIKNVTDSLLDNWNTKLANSLPNNAIEKTEESGMNS